MYFVKMSVLFCYPSVSVLHKVFGILLLLQWLFQFSLVTILLFCPLTFGSQDESFDSQNETSVLSAGKCGSSCEIAPSLVDSGISLPKKAQVANQCTDCEGEPSRPQDCFDILNAGENRCGIYTIFPRNRVLNGRPIKVYCDMQTDGGGWTVIQRRGHFQRPSHYFYKNWASYKRGFGELDEDFWLGNDIIYAISNQKKYSARFDLTDVEGAYRYAQYDLFWIDDETYKYTLHIQDYRGNAGDSMIAAHNGMKFTTKDHRNNLATHCGHCNKNCAIRFHGAWWYRSCHQANLNGLYLRGWHKSYADGVNWLTFKGHHESLEKTEIKLRPKPTTSYPYR